MGKGIFYYQDNGRSLNTFRIEDMLYAIKDASSNLFTLAPRELVFLKAFHFEEDEQVYASEMLYYLAEVNGDKIHTFINENGQAFVINRGKLFSNVREALSA